MIKACIFDLDGTLAYTLDSMAVVGNEVVKKFGLKPMPIENYTYYCGNGADMLVKRLLVDAGDPELLHYEEARALYRKEFDKDPFYKIQHYPGMPETLKKLKEHGMKLAVCSNKPHPAAVKVIAQLFDGEFDMVVGQSEAIRRKPAPTVYIPAALPVFISVLVSPTYIHSSGFTPNFSATISGPSGAGFLRIASLYQYHFHQQFY